MATPLHPRLRPKSCWPVLLCLAPGLRLTFHGCAADGQPYDRQGGTDSAPGGHDAAAACAPHSQSPAPAFLNEATRLSFSFSSIPLAAPLQLRRAGPHCGGGSAPLRPLFPRSTGSRHTGPSGCSSRRQALERRLRGCGAGLAAPRPARSSRTRARPVSRVGRQGPARCSTREGSGSRSCSARPRTWRERKRPEKLEGQHRRSLLDSRALLEYLRAAPLFHGLPRKYKLSVSTQVISKCY